MKMYTEVLGNMLNDHHWVEKLKNATIEHLDLDQWTAQKSRFIAKSEKGTEYGVALKRHTQVENGDILEYNPEKNTAVVIRIELKPVLIIDLQKIAEENPVEIIRRSVELGHAIGNQHWPAIVKGTKVYVPLTVDKKVMQSVMDTHHFENITYEFQPGQKIIPFLVPHEIRQLFGGASQEMPHIHEHTNGIHSQGHIHSDGSFHEHTHSSEAMHYPGHNHVNGEVSHHH